MWSAVKIVVTVALLAVLFSRVRWVELWGELRTAIVWPIVLAMAVRFVGVAISTLKWRTILGVYGVHYAFGRLNRWYLTGIFLSYLLPTQIGGDAYRAMKTWDNPRGATFAVSAVVLERATGMVASLLLGYLAVVVLYLQRGDALAGTVALLGTVALAVGLAATWALWRWRLIARVASARRCPAKVAKLLRVAADFPARAHEIWLIVATSFAFHLTRVLVIWLSVRAVGPAWNVLEVAVVAVGTDVVGILPISLGGLGLVDGAFVVLFGHFGLAHEIGLSAMVLMRAQQLVFNLPGAYFHFVGERGDPGPVPPATRAAAAARPAGTAGTPGV